MNTFVAVITRSPLYWSNRRWPVDNATGHVILPFKQTRRIRYRKTTGHYFWWYGKLVRISVRVQAKGRWVQ